MSYLQAWDASANVVQIGSILFSLSLYPHSSVLISSDYLLFALHRILQNMNNNDTEKIFNNIQQNAVIIRTYFANLI